MHVCVHPKVPVGEARGVHPEGEPLASALRAMGSSGKALQVAARAIPCGRLPDVFRGFPVEVMDAIHVDVGLQQSHPGLRCRTRDVERLLDQRLGAVTHAEVLGERRTPGDHPAAVIRHPRYPVRIQQPLGMVGGTEQVPGETARLVLLALVQPLLHPFAAEHRHPALEEMSEDDVPDLVGDGEALAPPAHLLVVVDDIPAVAVHHRGAILRTQCLDALLAGVAAILHQRRIGADIEKVAVLVLDRMQVHGKPGDAGVLKYDQGLDDGLPVIRGELHQ